MDILSPSQHHIERAKEKERETSNAKERNGIGVKVFYPKSLSISFTFILFAPFSFFYPAHTNKQETLVRH
jgi:hypothetical protein